MRLKQLLQNIREPPADSAVGYMSQAGGKSMRSMPFAGVGPIRVVYYTILLSHLVLAIVMVPFVVITTSRALRKRFDRHARIARFTFPIWLYVSITGVVVYLMLRSSYVPLA